MSQVTQQHLQHLRLAACEESLGIMQMSYAIKAQYQSFKIGKNKQTNKQTKQIENKEKKKRFMKQNENDWLAACQQCDDDDSRLRNSVHFANIQTNCKTATYQGTPTCNSKIGLICISYVSGRCTRRLLRIDSLLHGLKILIYQLQAVRSPKIFK